MLMVVVLLVVVVVVVVVIADFASWKESYPKIMSSYFFTALAGDEF